MQCYKLNHLLLWIKICYSRLFSMCLLVYIEKEEACHLILESDNTIKIIDGLLGIW